MTTALKAVTSLFGGTPAVPQPAVIPPPPPPPSPPTLANPASQNAGDLSSREAAAAAGGGFNATLLTGAEGAPAAGTAKQKLGD